MHEAFVAGLVLGLPAGFAPGPLLTVVITQTLRYGAAEGAKAGCAPLITDPPIIVLVVWILAGTASATALGVLSVAGGAFIAWLGVQTMRSETPDVDAVDAAGARSLRDAVIVNALSPNPYLFWAAVGGPLTVRFARDSWTAAALFLVTFFALMTICKVATAYAIAASRAWLTGRAYRWTLVAMGVLLLGMGAWLVFDGLRMLR